MLHLNTETSNNEQVSKVLGRILAETCLKTDYLLINPKNPQALSPSNPSLYSMIGECERPCSPWTFLVDADAWKFGGKTKLIFYILYSLPLFKKRSRAIVEKCLK